MRILQIHRDYAPTRGGGGVARHIWGLSRELAAKGATIIVGSAREPESPFTDDLHSARQMSVMERARQIRAADVVHIHASRSIYAATTALLCRLLATPYAYTPHCYYPSQSPLKSFAKDLWDRIVERRIVNGAACVFALNEYWRDWMRETFGQSFRVMIVPNCVRMADLVAMDERMELTGRPSILSVGRLDPVKRIGDAVKALALEGLENAVLHVVGTGSDAPAILALADNLGLADRVVLHGFLDDETVGKMMNSASMFVLASSTEGLPTVLIEAALRRCPIVVSDIPGNRGIADALGVDAIFPVGDIEAIASVIRRVAKSSAHGASNARAAFLYSWEHNAEIIVRAYADAAPAQSPVS